MGYLFALLPLLVAFGGIALTNHEKEEDYQKQMHHQMEEIQLGEQRSQANSQAEIDRLKVELAQVKLREAELQLAAQRTDLSKKAKSGTVIANSAGKQDSSLGSKVVN